jgi:hypothetical protein
LFQVHVTYAWLVFGGWAVTPIARYIRLLRLDLRCLDIFAGVSSWRNLSRDTMKIRNRADNVLRLRRNRTRPFRVSAAI